MLDNEITNEDIEEGLSILAWLVDRHGETAWPLFERLEKELEQRRSRQNRIQAHLKEGYT